MGLNERELIARRDGGDSLDPAVRSGGGVDDLMESGEVDEERLVELGLSPSEAQTFVEKFREFKIKKRDGKADPELEKELRVLAKKIADRKLEVLQGSGLNTALSEKGSEAQTEKDDLKEVTDADMKSLPPEYREMVEEYFKSIADEKR